ncbi:MULTISPECIES: halocyanin domain-containing protein [Halobacterium]|uniref:halocyanin domain-containing protein n=1 Tax=Halobacterium TaxID=2239 RepID=UPI00196365B5|nr:MULTISPECIES: halocyanin domain-containing protein [Halobacterium]MDL0121827.1 halocyanin domain-containing protein [Halobacterium salinarum]QRY25695.1 halocyanin domain-containing protein [Halobacterium sp. BOL4-2]
MTDSDSAVTRRRVLQGSAGAGAAAAGIGGFAAGGAAQSASIDDWLGDVSNYDGVRDETGSSEVTVDVGVDANGGAYGFGPAAVRVDPGTTVTFDWVSNTHNVAVESQPDSADWGGVEEINNEGYTDSHTFETAGVYTYFCSPHRAMGMKGAVVVGDADVGGAASGGIDWGNLGVLGAGFALGIGLLMPFVRRALDPSPHNPNTHE